MKTLLQKIEEIESGWGNDDDADWFKDVSMLCEVVKLLAKALDKTIPEVQWITNGLNLNTEQHVRIGDCIIEMHDALTKANEIMEGK